MPLSFIIAKLIVPLSLKIVYFIAKRPYTKMHMALFELMQQGQFYSLIILKTKLLLCSSVTLIK